MDFQKIDQLMETMPLRGIPGSELMVTLQGKTVYHRCSGIENTENGKPVNEKTLWWIYSASKISTCVAAMQLVEQGKIALDDPVSKYIPSFARMTVNTPEGPKPLESPMQIIHLFTMTGGLDYDLRFPAAKAAQDAQLDTVAVISTLAEKPLQFVPGTHYLYSLCHDALGAVISVVSGMSLSEYLKKNVWLPLGMEDTGFTPSEEQLSRIADMYIFDHSTGSAIIQPRFTRTHPNPNYESGGGGVFSSAGDYSKLMNALSLGGVSPEGRRILKQETVEMMEVNRLNEQCRKDLWNVRLFGYGWGLCGRVHMNQEYSLSRSSVGEFGWDGAAAAYGLADRKKGVSMFFATHVRGCDYMYCWVHPLLRNMVYDALEL